MNLIFLAVFILSCVVLAINDPNAVLSSLTVGANKAVTLSLSLVAIFIVWSGALQVAEKSGICSKIAKLLRPAIRFLFGKTDEETENLIAVNMSANMLGMGGIATPPAIKATGLMNEKGNYDGAATLFIVAATSVQLLPSTVLSLRQSLGSEAPASILLPTVLSTALSSVFGIAVMKLTTIRRKKK